MKCFSSRTLPAVALSICIGTVRAAEPIPNSFSYQGHLTQNGESANGAFDLRFSMFNVATGGSPSFGTITLANTSISNGIFSTYLDFGPGAFDGSARWLEIGARPSGSLAPFTALTPRQALTATPYAFFAQQAGSVANGAVSNEKLANGAVTSSKLSTPAGPLPGQVLSFGGGSLLWVNATSGNEAKAWRLGGNAGTLNGTDFLGTTDASPLELRASGNHALSLHFVSNSPSILGGWFRNFIAPSAWGSVIAGGGGPPEVFNGPTETGNRITSEVAFIGGGAGNFVAARLGVIGGGGGNQISSNGMFSAVVGGSQNTAGGSASFVGGGINNKASETTSVVGGGSRNEASGNSSMVGGGQGNAAIGSLSSVAGGEENRATGDRSGVLSGSRNIVSGSSSTVAGGTGNNLTGSSSFVGAGTQNSVGGNTATIGGGNHNVANGPNSFIGGGSSNLADGQNSTVPGGSSNSASGEDSFAAGRRAKAMHRGSFVWSDSSNIDLATSAPNQFVIRASGGTKVFSNGPSTSGVTLSPGGGSWSSLSDRNSKTNLVPIDSQEILSKVAALPVFTWSYKSQPDSIRHIGPTAQDFAAAFKVGEDDKHIAAVDPDGVALAAIQGLNELVRTQSASLLDKERRIQELEKAVTELRHLIANRP